MARTRVPCRNDIWLISLDPQAGREMMKTRPCVVLSPEEYNKATGLALVCPITSAEKGYPFEVPLPHNARVSGVILADQIKSIDWTVRAIRRVTTIDPAVVEDAVARLSVLLRRGE